MPCGVQQMRAHILCKMGRADALREQAPIDIRKGIQFGLKGRLASVLRRVEDVEKVVQYSPHVAAIGLGVILDQLEENVFRLEYASVVSEQAKQ